MKLKILVNINVQLGLRYLGVDYSIFMLYLKGLSILIYHIEFCLSDKITSDFEWDVIDLQNMSKIWTLTLLTIKMIMWSSSFQNQPYLVYQIKT